MTFTFARNFLKDKNPQELSRRLGIAGTVLFWLILLVCLLLIKPGTKKEKYKTVQIVLSSTKTEQSEKQEESSVKSDSTDENVSKIKEENPSPSQPEITEQKPAETPSAAANKEPLKTKEKAPANKNEKTAEKTTEALQKTEIKEKTSEQKTIPVQKTENVEYAKSVDDLMNEQFLQPKKAQQDFDWSMFDDESSDSTAVSDASVKTVASSSSISGSAGTVSDTQENTHSISENKSVSGENNAVSKSTKEQLNTIRESNFNGGTGSSTVKTSSKIKNSGKNSEGKLMYSMSNGYFRALLDPSSPSVTISEKNASLIDTTRNVTITFKVTASGNVPLADISILPESTLPLAIRQEIAEQISKWKFEPADYDASANMDLTINLK